MSFSRGTCSLCRCVPAEHENEHGHPLVRREQHEPSSSVSLLSVSSSLLRSRNPVRRRNRRRNLSASNEASPDDEDRDRRENTSIHPKSRKERPPSLVLIHDGGGANAGEANSKSNAPKQDPGLVLCKWKHGETSWPMPGNIGSPMRSILRFDDSVRIVSRGVGMVRGNSCDNGGESKGTRAAMMEDLLRNHYTYVYDNMDNYENVNAINNNNTKNNNNKDINNCGDGRYKKQRTSWNLGDVDPTILGESCSCNDDPNPHRENKGKKNAGNGHPRRLAILESGSVSPHGPRGVALPLYGPSVALLPLQSVMISIVGGGGGGGGGFRDKGKDNGSDLGEERERDRLSILREAFWKRQLVGRVFAFDDQWTTRVRLDSDGPPRDGSSAEHSNAVANVDPFSVYARVESCTPMASMRMTTTPTHTPTSASSSSLSHWSSNANANANSNANANATNSNGGGCPSSLPRDFCVVLPSTYITIRHEHCFVPVPVPMPEEFPEQRHPPRSERSALLEKPPSPAARRLVETLRCIRSNGSCDANANADVPRSFLLSGAPGVGKTFSVSWTANAFPDTVVCSLRGSELLQQKGGATAPGTKNPGSPSRALEWEFLRVVRALSRTDVDSMTQTTKHHRPPDAAAPAAATTTTGLIFLDECDALVSVEPVAAMLAALLDRVSGRSTGGNAEERCWKRIVVVGATNRIDSIPSYLRRAGRFDREIPMAPPQAGERARLLASLLGKVQQSNSGGRAQEQKQEHHEQDSSPIDPERNSSLPSPEELREFAELCVGYVAADLSALVRKAWLLRLQDKAPGDSFSISIAHLEAARRVVGASALRDASLAAPPKITWDDIAGDPGGAKTALRRAIEWPRLKAREFALLGLQPCRGILLHGPPGCAKTTLARAAAGSSGVAFLSLSPAQVYASSYVGEAERVVRQAFHLARSTAPCVLFFDEIDSIFGSCGGNGGGSGDLGGSGRGSSAEARVLSTFLNEMDGVDIAGAGADGVLVLGATNRPWTLDPALLRPGRLGDKIVYLPPPDAEARQSIFAKQFGGALVFDDDKNGSNGGSRNSSSNNRRADSEMTWDVDPSILVDLSKGMTGAEILGACQEAKIHWMREKILRFDQDSGTMRDESEDDFTQQDCIVNSLLSVKPLLSNPEALEEFRIFENQDKKGFLG